MFRDIQIVTTTNFCHCIECGYKEGWLQLIYLLNSDFNLKDIKAFWYIYLFFFFLYTFKISIYISFKMSVQMNPQPPDH